ncbi:MAG: DUF1700 domain-containing protein [Lachnospiraceae bacterium]|nr:DUF1700 domain-containing protein [Lachnospiraceae bacterium]
MTRQEFITELRQALQGQVDQATLQDNLNYYETYIMQESRKGRTEQEVLDELGNPRLIAKTIINSQPEEAPKRRSQESYNEDYGQQQGSDFDFRVNGRSYSGWKGIVLAITAVIALIVIVVGIIALVAGTISLLAPVLIPILLILLALRLISRR